MTDVELPVSVKTDGFSDAVSRILSHTGVPRPKKIKREKRESPERKPIVQSVDAVQSDDVKPDETGDITDVTPKTKSVVGRAKRLTKNELDPWHVLPDVTVRDKERKLAKTATRGVVQLFNAVRAQQTSLEEKLEEAGPSFRKSEQALKSVSKGAFLDLLKNTSGSVNIRRGEAKSADNFEETSVPKRWEVLDDEYMTRKTAGGEDSSDDGQAEGYAADSDSGESLEEIF